MFVVTADQVGSRIDIDRSAAMLAALDDRFADDLALPADQTAGDEIQVVTASAQAALDLVLDLSRTEHWSIGLGVGRVRMPLPDAARKATGPAFFAAREAVDAAKRTESRFALRADVRAGSIDAADVEPLIRILLLLRSRRSEQGWEVIDLIRAGNTQKRAASLLGISPAAVSQRLRAAMWSVDDEARTALVRLLAELDARSGQDDGPR
jgi:hypothetical protein